MGGVEALAGYGAGSRLEFLLVPLAYGIGGPVGIVIGANLDAGQIEWAVKACWIGVLMACTLTELIGLAAAAFPQQWIRIFSQDPFVLQVGAEYLHRVGKAPLRCRPPELVREGHQDAFWAAVFAWRWRKSTSVRNTSAKLAPPS
jgi:Na+-driven multidrug efflux pump